MINQKKRKKPSIEAEKTISVVETISIGDIIDVPPPLHAAL
jgi:hypothetical protein